MSETPDEVMWLEAGALGGGAEQLRDEVPTEWGLVAAIKKERLPHDERQGT
jgi:hypothetical protein